METLTREETRQAFREGKAPSSGDWSPFANPWAEACRDLMRAYEIRATWIDPARIDESRSFPVQKRIEAPFPRDARTGAIVMHEVMHVILDDQVRDLPKWQMEMRVSEAVCDNVELRDDLAEHLDTVEYTLSRRLATTYLANALERHEVTRSEIEARSERPSLVGWHGEWLGITARPEPRFRDDGPQMWGPAY